MWETLRKEEVILKLNTDEKNGINEIKAKEKILKDGKNIIKDEKKENIFFRFLKQFNDFMIIILIIASIVSAMISNIQGENDYIDSIIIITIVVLNAIMGLIQETKAEKSIEALKKLTPKKAKVIREGIIKEINVEDLVIGDLVILESGSYVPADCRLIETHNLKIEESSLTGENIPSIKDSEYICKRNMSIGDKKNMAFMSSWVVNGTGKGIVTQIGMNTAVGKIANMIIKNESPQTPIQKKLDQVGKILGISCVSICVVIFLIGVIKNIDPIEMFMTAIGLAVAAIPEGLPAIVTIVLSIGVTKMAKKNSIIRKLPAVETLGSSNVICSDKTGTLTQNKMKVVEIESLNEKMLLEYASLCTDCKINDKFEVVGEPTEKAIVEKCLDFGKNKVELEKNMPRVNEIPFDSNRKMMTTIHKKDNKYIVITKGAPDVLIEKCIGIDKYKVKNQNFNMANRALRVIAVCYKELSFLPYKIDSESIENNLNFLGLIGMIDPPREGVKEAVNICKNAGIKTVMITGDHLETAKAIATKLDILSFKDKAITGNELDKMSQKELENEIEKYAVFARVTPEHKVRIVNAWQKKGACVAMTGDGVNDSPALKNADIGIAMGKNGTDVAKNAADMILTDDNFVTIVEAIKEGRNIYDNIKKAVHFLISTNIGEIVAIFIGLILGMDSPLLAIQLLWVNLVTDSLPAIGLGLEPCEKDIMNRKPISSKKSLFADGLWSKILLEGIMIGMLTLISFGIGNKYFGLEVARTMAFVSIGVLELVHSFNVRSEKSIFSKNVGKNRKLIGLILLGFIIQIIVVIVPQFAKVFKLVSLNFLQWFITSIICIMPIFIIELQKLFESKNDFNVFEKNLNFKRDN